MSTKEKEEERVRNFNEDEKKFLLAACEPYLSLINDRARSKVAKKNEAWDDICQKFNSNEIGYKRTVQQLRKYYYNHHSEFQLPTKIPDAQDRGDSRKPNPKPRNTETSTIDTGRKKRKCSCRHTRTDDAIMAYELRCAKAEAQYHELRLKMLKECYEKENINLSLFLNEKGDVKSSSSSS